MTIGNVGGSPLKWSASLDPTGAFAISGASSGAIAPGGTAPLVLSAESVPAMAYPGEVLETTLRIATSDPDRPSVAIPVRVQAEGALLSVKPPNIDFGQVPLGVKDLVIDLAVTNVGDADVQISLLAPQDGDLVAAWTGSPAPATLAAGGVLAAKVLFTPTAPVTVTDTTSLVVEGPVCGSPPPPIGINAEGTKGVAGVTPGALDFGLVDCGTVAAAQQVTVLNAGNGSFDFSAALGLGSKSPYTVSPASGTVPPNSQVVVVVTPKGVPQSSAVTSDLYADTLTVTTTAQGDTAHQVLLHETARGAILSTSGPLDFGRHKVGSSATKTLTLSNTGNAAAQVTVMGTGSFSGGSAPVPSSGSAGVSIGYAPDPKLLGQKESGALKLSTADTFCAPVPTTSATGTSYDRAVSVAAGAAHTCAIAVSGFTYCWGRDASGECGDGKKQATDWPVPVVNLAGATQLALGAYDSCALVQGGTVECWGENTVGQLGNGTTVSSSTPVTVSGLNDAVSIGCGDGDSYAVRSGGTVAAWGGATLGNGTLNTSAVPVAVSNVTDAVSVAGQRNAACAIGASGDVYCWGSDSNGQLGDGTNNLSTVPVVVSGLTDATGRTSGTSAYGTCVLRSGGAVACWGYGPLGNGDKTSNVPVPVTGLVDATSVAVGAAHACALRSGGENRLLGRQRVR